jgi:hypothetical protein
VKISRIELYTVELPYSGGVYLLSGGRTYESFSASIVRVLCDDGTEGLGREHTVRVDLHRRPRHGRSGRDRGAGAVAPGADPRRTDRIAELMDSTLVGHTTPRRRLQGLGRDPRDINFPFLIYCNESVGQTSATSPV